MNAAGATVVRAADVAVPATETQARDPWPADLYGWISKLPGVATVAAPTPVTIGGAPGTRFTVTTPAMHPLFHEKGESMWVGGGNTGLDPAYTRQFIVLTVSGATLVIEYDDVASQFDQRVRQIDAIVDSITFKASN